MASAPLFAFALFAFAQQTPVLRVGTFRITVSIPRMQAPKLRHVQ
ncbi:MAG: hypothetical protein OJF51_000583 [Nitrospira sp.]|nr:MAG: hypothetical protein OJF51_000583 [Nitrospira sp.]